MIGQQQATVAHNCHIKTNAHSKLQIAHIKFKSLTANSNRSQQIQIAHSKFKSLTANYKSLTANSNRPQQIQIVHSKLKSLTANSSRSQQIQIAHIKLPGGVLVPFHFFPMFSCSRSFFLFVPYNILVYHIPTTLNSPTTLKN